VENSKGARPREIRRPRAQSAGKGHAKSTQNGASSGLPRTRPDKEMGGDAAGDFPKAIPEKVRGTGGGEPGVRTKKEDGKNGEGTKKHFIRKTT